MKKLYFLLIICVTINSCKDSRKKAAATTSTVETQKEQTQIIKDQFEMNFTAIYENNDKVTLFFLEEGQKNITVKNSVSVDVFGSSEPQKLNFRIKENTIPHKLFLRFGEDNEAQKITIVKTELLYAEDTIVIEKEKFYQFFNPNQYINYDRKNFVAIAKPVNGTYKPRFISRKVLEDRILLHLN